VVRIKDINLNPPTYQPLRVKSDGESEPEKMFGPVFDAARLDAARGRKTQSDHPISAVRERKKNAVKRHKEDESPAAGQGVSTDDRLQSPPTHPETENQDDGTTVSDVAEIAQAGQPVAAAGQNDAKGDQTAVQDGSEGTGRPADGQNESNSKISPTPIRLIEAQTTASDAEVSGESASTKSESAQNQTMKSTVQIADEINSAKTTNESLSPADNKTQQTLAETIPTGTTQRETGSSPMDKLASQAQLTAVMTKKESKGQPDSKATPEAADKAVKVRIETINAGDNQQADGISEQIQGQSDIQQNAVDASSQSSQRTDRPVQHAAPAVVTAAKNQAADQSESDARTDAKDKESQRTEPQLKTNAAADTTVSQQSDVAGVLDGAMKKNDAESKPAAAAINQAATAITNEKPVDLKTAFAANSTDNVQVADVQKNIDQVVRAAKASVNQNGSRIQIRLEPPDLGTLHVEIRQNAAGLQVSLQATTARAQQLLQQNAHELRSALEAQGLPASQIDIQLRQDFRGDGGSSAREQSQWGQQQTGEQASQQFNSFFSQQNPYPDGQANPQRGFGFDEDNLADAANVEPSPIGQSGDNWREIQFTQVNVLA
jgi:flagellar hook-length control protein FliK